MLQIAFYGISLVLNCVVLSIFIVFLNIQNHSMNTDYLTGVNNRKNLEAFLKKKVEASMGDKTFSAILIDLNNFKSINDTFGHDMGDNALQTSSKLLASCLRSNDFVARFGGDEFYIVLDISDKKDLEALVCRIKKCFENYNKSLDQPYKLGLSMGYAVYDCHSHMSVEDFQKHIDILMYKDKQRNKQGDI
jgi:diguanylate cyclase (GGDEF)-like protein